MVKWGGLIWMSEAMTKQHSHIPEGREIVSISCDPGEVTLVRTDAPDAPYSTHYITESDTESNISYQSDNLDKARLVVGLFLNIDEPLNQRDLEVTDSGDHTVPVAVAVARKEYVAAYLKIREDQVAMSNTRATVAHLMGVTKQTVSNYFNRARWSGCTTCGSQDTGKRQVSVGGDEVSIVECYECSSYYVMPEDMTQQTHDQSGSSEAGLRGCVDELDPVTAIGGGDEFRLWRCPGCGYYTTEPQRSHTS